MALYAIRVVAVIVHVHVQMHFNTIIFATIHFVCVCRVRVCVYAAEIPFSLWNCEAIKINWIFDNGDKTEEELVVFLRSHDVQWKI